MERCMTYINKEGCKAETPLSPGNRTGRQIPRGEQEEPRLPQDPRAPAGCRAPPPGRQRARGTDWALAAARRTAGYCWESARVPAGSASGPGREGRGCSAYSRCTPGGSGAGVPRFSGADGRPPRDTRATLLLSGLPPHVEARRTLRPDCGRRARACPRQGATHPARTPWRFHTSQHSPPTRAKLGFRSLDLGPDQVAGIHGADGKLVARLQSPLPRIGTHSCPLEPLALRGSASSRTPPSHLPASAARPGLSQPVARSSPPEPELLQIAGPSAGAESCPESGDGRRAPRASERASKA
ncbi:hypothetical protein H1C71_017009 [Ictidomys tridecemlineatus]|nr:hypothetical protein H1C71_017009 [Ictidomys tridecemlineatus]